MRYRATARRFISENRIFSPHPKVMKIPFSVLATTLIFPIFCTGEVPPGMGAPVYWHAGGTEYPPSFLLDTSFAPIEGWRIFKGEPGRDYEITNGSQADDLAFYFVDFDKSKFFEKSKIQLPDGPILLGWEVTKWHTARLKADTRGIARLRAKDSSVSGVKTDYTVANPKVTNIKGKFLTLEAETKFTVSPTSPPMHFIAYPAIQAESHGDFLTINSYDIAGITVGVAQMASHDHKDLLAMFKSMLSDEKLLGHQWDSFHQWFPELSLNEQGKLTYNYNGKVGSLEGGLVGDMNPTGAWEQMPENFIRFCNPEVAHTKPIDDEELHFIARWVVWSLSKTMREAQMVAVSEQFVKKVGALASGKQLTGEDLACAAVLYHWSDGASMSNALKSMLKEKDPAKVFFSLPSGQLPSYFASFSSDRVRISERVNAVNQLFTAQPDVRTTLKNLRYKNGILQP